jgi:hypothetical protein
MTLFRFIDHASAQGREVETFPNDIEDEHKSVRLDQGHDRGGAVVHLVIFLGRVPTG